MTRRGNGSKQARRSARLKRVQSSAAQFHAPALIVAATPEGLIEGIYTWSDARAAKPGQPEFTLSISTFEGAGGESWFAAWLLPEVEVSGP